MATEKQKAVVREITENHRSVSSAMKKVGYKSSTATKPSNLTKSKGWAELMEQYYPDDKITKIQNKLLKASLLRHDTFELTYSEREIRKIITSAGGKVSVIKRFDPIEKTKSEKKQKGYWFVYFIVPDQRIVDSTLDKILKTKGRYVTKIQVEDKRKYGSISDEDLLKVASGEKEIEEVVND
jgi:hypothetical protein